MEERTKRPSFSSKSSTSTSTIVGGTVKLQNLSASWNIDQTTLSKINLIVANKELIAIVGHVGAGKVIGFKMAINCH